MRNRFGISLISVCMVSLPAMADFGLSAPSDFTGEAFFRSSAVEPMTPETAYGYDESETADYSKQKGSIPPIKYLRLKLRDKMTERRNARMEYAPAPKVEPYQGEVSTSEYASKEIKDEFEELPPDGFEADEESVAEQKKRGFFTSKKREQAVEAKTEEIILDCENVDYDTQNYLIHANGDVNIEFVKQNTTVKADVVTFDRMNNTIKAEGNVKILKNGKTVTGDYIFVDMNEENALIENPVSTSDSIEIRSKKGYVYGDKLVLEKGNLAVEKDNRLEFHSAGRGPQMRRMLIPKGASLSEDMQNGVIKFEAKEIKINQKGDLETIAIKKGTLKKGEKTIFKVPAVKIYTNKNHEYYETNIWEIGSYRGLGVYTGPGWVFELPKGSVLKAMPIINYKSGFGIGALGRFSSGTNQTIGGYGTSANRFLLYGKQELDDNLFLQYGANSYLDEWFLGRRRPKYGVSLVYNKEYSSKDFLIKGQNSSYAHRLEAGYFQNLDYDGNFEKIQDTRHLGTTRFRYMGQARQNLYSYRNEEKLTEFNIGVASQLSAAVYGTGDTQVIGRLGPYMHTQYRRWMQDIGYYISAFEDNTPMVMYDAYRYGKQNLYLREYFRICKWLTVSWFTSINLSNDSPNHKTYQENAFYFSIGPDDFKFHLGYDFVRENLYCTFEMMMDTKGANVDYETLEIKQDKKAKKSDTTVGQVKPNNMYTAPTKPKVLDKAVVEDLKVMEDVL